MKSSVKYLCRHCNHKQTRETGWIDPKLFIGKAEMKALFWCPNCELNVCLVYEFRPHGKVNLLRQEETAKLFGKQPEKPRKTK